MDPTARRHRTVLIAAIAGGLILLFLIGVGVYGLIRGPQTTEPAEPKIGRASCRERVCYVV